MWFFFYCSFPQYGLSKTNINSSPTTSVSEIFRSPPSFSRCGWFNAGQDSNPALSSSPWALSHQPSLDSPSLAFNRLPSTPNPQAKRHRLFPPNRPGSVLPFTVGLYVKTNRQAITAVFLRDSG